MHGTTLAGAFFGAGGFNYASALAGVLAFAAVICIVARALGFACVDTEARDCSGFFRCHWRGGFGRCFAATCRSKEAGGGDCSDGSGANWVFHCKDLYDETQKRYGFQPIFWSFYRPRSQPTASEFSSAALLGAICPKPTHNHLALRVARRLIVMRSVTSLRAGIS